MDYFTPEHAEKLHAELRLVELSLGTAQQRYAYFVQLTSTSQDRGALETAIQNLKIRRYELMIKLLTIQNFNG